MEGWGKYEVQTKSCNIQICVTTDRAVARCRCITFSFIFSRKSMACFGSVKKTKKQKKKKKESIKYFNRLQHTSGKFYDLRIIFNTCINFGNFMSFSYE